jgi:hypothetical protein
MLFGKEMDAFIKECEAAGPAKTVEEQTARNDRFVEIQRRIAARILEVGQRAAVGNPAPHLAVVRKT